MLKRILLILTALAGWFALLIQLPITVANSRAVGMSIIGGAIAYLSFFTILTNLLVATSLTCSLWPRSSWGGFFSRPVVTSALAAYAAMVGAGYSLLLRHVWNPEGLQKIADILLHDLVPLMYLIYWLIFLPKRGLRWKNALQWLIYPVVYLCFVLIRGGWSGRYPYYFLDASKLGYLAVASNAIKLLCAFLVVALFVVVIGRWMGRRYPDERKAVSKRSSRADAR
ncbi:MAG TPA: Pr6Pr family membrane protein [Candidatus Acidoferrales bacterium]|nr:Pr6Pr family membrane protein [Candidatus Acidoferrales bacterium]